MALAMASEELLTCLAHSNLGEEEEGAGGADHQKKKEPAKGDEMDKKNYEGN
ncbi:hypothetical protein Dimus_010009, partial [Dionaea muscipula]